MAYYPLEQPTGTIDGANTVFTLSNNIYTIDHIYIDGLIYLGTYTWTGAVVTVGDAPVVSIYIDYYSTAPTPPPPISVPGFLTLQDAYDAVKARLKDISDVPQATFIQWCQYWSDFVYRTLIGTDPERFIQLVNFSTVPGEASYLLNLISTTFRDASTWGTGLFPVNGSGEVLKTRLPQSNYGDGTAGWYITGDKDTCYITITPLPREVTAYILRYMPEAPIYSAMGDYFTLDKTISTARIVPSEFLRFLTEALCTLYFIWDEDPNAEALSDARFTRCLDEFVRHIRKDTPVYGLSDFSLTF